MHSEEIPISFYCGGARLHGIVHRPATASSRGVLLLAGRPALRSGRHRLFVLLSRVWAEAGTPVMRFDYRGSGDSEGEMPTLAETCEDIFAAIDAFQSNVPGLQEVVLWGLCGGAADAILYAPGDERVTGLVLANPWLYDSLFLALGTLHRRISMYLWKLRTGLRAARKAAAATYPTAPRNVAEALAEPAFDQSPDMFTSIETGAVSRAYRSYRVANISKRLSESLREFRGSVLIILSGRDTGAQAFKHTTARSWSWRRILSSARVRTHELPEANHSLRRTEWRADAASATLEWLRSLA